MTWILLAVMTILLPFAALKLSAPLSRRLKRKTEASQSGDASDRSDLIAKYSKKYAWLPVAVLALVVLYFGVYTQSWKSPSPTEVGGVGQDAWFWLLFLWGITSTLIAILTKGTVAKWLHGVLAVVMIALIVAFPLYRWLATRPTTPQAAVVLPQDTPNLPRAWKADGTATDMSTWLKLKVPAHGDSQHVPGLYGGHVVWGGSGFSVRCVYADGHEGVVSEGTCSDGNIVKSYARNNSGTDLWASYAYAKAGEK